MCIQLSSDIYYCSALDVHRDQSTLDMAGTFYFNIGKLSESVYLFEEAYIKGPLNEAVILHLVSGGDYTSLLM
jgi:hypothetical protein